LYDFLNVEYGAKKFGCRETEVKQIMMSRINNLAKVEKAKQKTCEK
jgi:hypothetical protein